jgi:hypothetical protein
VFSVMAAINIVLKKSCTFVHFRATVKKRIINNNFLVIRREQGVVEHKEL